MPPHLCRLQRLLAHHLRLRPGEGIATQGAQQVMLDAANDDCQTQHTLRSQVNCLPYRRNMSLWTDV